MNRSEILRMFKNDKNHYYVIYIINILVQFKYCKILKCNKVLFKDYVKYKVTPKSRKLMQQLQYLDVNAWEKNISHFFKTEEV